MHIVSLGIFLGTISIFFSFSVARAESPVLTMEKNGVYGGTLLPDMPSLGGIALADLGTDDTVEIIATTGYGSPTEVVVLRKDGSRIGSFAPYAQGFSGGASVAVCDLDSDGDQEIITGAGFSGGPHVRIFDHLGNFSGVHFFAYDEAFTGGVFVTCADVTQDGVLDIITTPGPTGGPHLRVFSRTGALIEETYLGGMPDNTGIVASPVFSSERTRTELVVTPSAFSSFGSRTIAYQDGSFVFVDEQTPAIAPTAFSLSASDTEEDHADTYRISAPVQTALADDVSSQYIRVDISEQRLTAYSFGIPVMSFLVSTGVASYPTPLGKTTVTDKLPVHDYSWYYGAGDARNYSLPNVLWNLRFRPHYYIHSAYWHNNFGHPMSHGCVNVSIPDAERVYAWANVGTPVEIIE